MEARNTGKKALILSARALVGLVLTAFILFSFISCTSKFVGLKSQAREKFLLNVESIKNLQANNPDPLGFILDERTALVYFEPAQNVIVTSQGHQIIFKRPSFCGEEERCLCLFEEVEIEQGDTLSSISAIRSTCRLKEFTTPLVMDSCDLYDEEPSYSCQYGFVIERLFSEDINELDEEEYITPRRVNLLFTRERSSIQVSHNE